MSSMPNPWETASITMRTTTDPGNVLLHLGGPRITGDGYSESCVLDREGNRVELTEIERKTTADTAKEAQTWQNG